MSDTRRKVVPLLVQLANDSIGDVTVSIDEAKITPELAKLNTIAATISTTTSSNGTTLSTVSGQLTAKNSANEDKTVAQSAVDACTKLESIEKSTSATAQSLVDDPTAPAADQVKVGAAVKRIRDTIGQTTDAETENTTIGLLKKIKINTEGTSTISGTVSIQADQLATLATETTQSTLGKETTLATRASEATLALVTKDTTTQALKSLVGTADDTAGTNTVIGLLKGIVNKLS